jgi:hypoxanthine phosphoribosyltransferase
MRSVVYAPGLNPYVSAESIVLAVRRLGHELTEHYRHKNPVLLGVLKGSFVFLADLVRELDFPLELDFACCRSYHGTRSGGRVKMALPPRAELGGRHVLLVEDIVDTGITTRYLLDYLREKHPASLRLCALLDKPSRRRAEVKIDYLGFSVPDKFIVGYGLDCSERFRNLPGLYTMVEE